MRKGRKWLKQAERVKPKNPGYTMNGQGGVCRITLHTSESDPGSINGVVNWITSQKNVGEYHLVLDEKLKKAVQLFPFDEGAKSMVYWDAVGVLNIQICIVDHARNAPFESLSDWAWKIIRDIAIAWDIPRVVHKSGSLEVWNSRSGIFRHMDAPYNSSGDPGPIARDYFRADQRPHLFKKKDEPDVSAPTTPVKPPKKRKKVSRVLRVGSKGKAVRKLQRALKADVDGIFGPQTERKVKRFQRKKCLPVDGVVGRKTWRKLGFKYVSPYGKLTKNTDTRWPTNKRLVNKLRRVAKDVGLRVHIKSGYRSNAEQAVLYQRYLSGNGPVAAPPGSSRHNTGDAADCGVVLADGTYVNIGSYGPAREAMKKVGLGLPVPGEPWHVEITGRWLA